MPKTLGRHLAQNSRTTNNTSTPLAGMEKNNQGGYTHVANPWERAERFLIIGTEGGTFYADERELTIKGAHSVRQCIAEDANRLVGMIARVSAKGLAVRQDAALLALALVFAEGDDVAKKHAREAFRAIVRTGYHLLRFVETVRAVKAKPGLGRSLRGVIGNWFESFDPADLFYQLSKYQNREGWGMGDVMRLVHPTPKNETQRALYGFATKGVESITDGPSHTVEHFLPSNALQYVRVMRWAREREMTPEQIGKAVLDSMRASVPREALPADWMALDEAWAAQAIVMPIHALIRNVATLAAHGIIPPATGDNIVASRIREIANNSGNARKARLHPFAVLVALRMYAKGSNRRGTWIPNRHVTEALEELLFESATVHESTGQRILYACDTSGSMQSEGIAGNEAGINCAEVGALLAYLMTRSEPNSIVVGFNSEVTPWNVTRRTSLDEMQRLATAGGGTNCAAPVTWATEQGIMLDAIVVITDNETTGGNFHASKEMEEYRRKINPKAKLISAAMSADRSTIADPKDPLGLNIVGMSAEAGAAINAFLGGM